MTALLLDHTVRRMTSATLAVALPTTATLGFGFIALGYAATFLMLHLWGFGFDKSRRKSEAPRWAMWLHRGLGYAFLVLYVVMMWRMVPRLWTYQVELPARSVAHLLLGFTVGFLLLIKISILRLFRHLEEWMPYLGVGILLCATLLLVLSLPSALREHALAHGAPGGDPFGPESLERVARLLPDADLPAGTELRALATGDGLRAGRDVLLGQCTTCHDLKTVLDRPRPPSTWTNVVARMAEKPTLFGTLSEVDQGRVIAYLIAITPELQRSAKRRKEDALQLPGEDPTDGEIEVGPLQEPALTTDAGIAVLADAGVAVVADAGVMPDAGVSVTAAAGVVKPPAAPIDPAAAQSVFNRKCSGCHETSDIDANPPRSQGEVRVLVKRMIENGLRSTRHELELVNWWLVAHYVRHIE